jgi:hypothetical protein
MPPGDVKTEADDQGGHLAARLELQSRLLEVLRRDLEEARLAGESKDRATMQTWRRLRLCEMLLEESQRDRDRLAEDRDRVVAERDRLEAERARLSDELLRLRSTLSWRITTPLRRLPRLGGGSTPPAGPAREKP